MMKNCYTIFILPPKAEGTRQYSFRKWILYVLTLLLFVFIAGDYIAIVKYRESAVLKEENSRLKVKKKELEEVSRIVDEIKKDEQFIRDFLGLEKSGSNMGGFGLGGLDPAQVDTSAVNLLVPRTEQFMQNSDCEQSLLEKSQCLKNDLKELIGELRDRKSDWDTKPTILPVKTDEYRISSGYGWRKSPFTGLREFHRGLDISSRRGTPIIAPAEGKIISTGKDRYIGKFIKIRHSDSVTTLYGHLLEYEVKKGQQVARGETIGLMGNTGMSTGYHLHYEVRVDKKSANPNHYILNSKTAMNIH
jgi:murein DD-endopeptidase MepM/ murein hydrolase activator NlpD